MVDPKVVLSYPAYDFYEYPVNVADRKKAKEDPYTWDRYLVDFISERKPLLDANDNFIGAMSGWRVVCCYDQTVKIENENLPKNIYGNSFSINMNYCDFINSLILRGIPIDSAGYIDTPVFFYRLNRYQTYQVEVEGSKIYEVFMEAYQKGYHKRINYLKLGHVYKMLLRRAQVVTNGWNQSYPELVRGEVKHVMVVSREAFPVVTEIINMTKGEAFRKSIKGEGPLEPTYDNKGSFGSVDFKSYQGCTVLKDIDSGAYYIVSSYSQEEYFPFEEMYKDPTWINEKQGISFLNMTLAGNYPNYLRKFFDRAKSSVRFFEDLTNYKIAEETSLVQFSIEQNEFFSKVKDNSHKVIEDVVKSDRFADTFKERVVLSEAI